MNLEFERQFCPASHSGDAPYRITIVIPDNLSDYPDRYSDPIPVCRSILIFKYEYTPILNRIDPKFSLVSLHTDPNHAHDCPHGIGPHNQPADE